MKLVNKMLLVPFAVALSTAVHASNTADLKVVGTVAPGSCVPTFSGGGIIDHGKIATSSLNMTTPTPLPQKTLDYDIQCDAPIRIGMIWNDNRPGTASTTGLRNFGLGKQEDKNIGFYTVTTKTPMADGGVVGSLVSLNDGGWARADYNNNNRSTKMSFAPGVGLVPMPFRVFTGTLAVNTSIAPSNTLDLSNEINLDGLATLEIRYL